MEFAQFYAKFGKRLLAWVRRYRAQIGAPLAFQADLEQTAWLTVLRKLPSWNPDLGDQGLNPFNYCAPSILSEMYAEWRRHQGYKPFGASAMDSSFVEFEPDMAVDDSHTRAAEVCDMRRCFSAYPRPSHLVRFVMVALSPASAAELGRNIGLTRQAVSTSVRGVRRELAEAMG